VVRKSDDVRPDPGVSRIRESEQTAARLADWATSIASTTPVTTLCTGKTPI
jgi:hypothetical protein